MLKTITLPIIMEPKANLRSISISIKINKFITQASLSIKLPPYAPCYYTKTPKIDSEWLLTEVSRKLVDFLPAFSKNELISPQPIIESEKTDRMN